MEYFCHPCNAVRSDLCPDDAHTRIIAHVADVLREEHPRRYTDTTLWAEDILTRYPQTAVIARHYADGMANRAWLQGAVAYAVASDEARDTAVAATMRRMAPSV